MIKMIIRIGTFIVIIVFATLYFISITELSKSGEIIMNLKEELTSLQKENRAISLDMSKRNFLGAVESGAKEQGMVYASKHIYLTTPPSIAVSKR